MDPSKSAEATKSLLPVNFWQRVAGTTAGEQPFAAPATKVSDGFLKI